MTRIKRFWEFSKGGTVADQLANYVKVILIWCPVVTVLFIFGFGGVDRFGWRFMISMIIAMTVSSSCFLGSWLVSALCNWYRARRGLSPIVDGLGWGVLTSYPFLLPGLYLGFTLAGEFSTAIGRSWDPPGFSDYSSGVVFGLMVSSLFSLFEVIRRSKVEQQAAELKVRNLENEKLKAQVSALAAQMNPHLLFNSLNTIASTIGSDPKSAEDMVVQLSDLYRGILKSAKGDMHTLENELDLVRSYLEIEKKRFGPRVEYEIRVDDEIDPKKVRIPVLILQPLVENAVKHGLTPKREGGSVIVEIRQDKSHFILNVTDNGIGPREGGLSAGTGTGLSNCESRVRLKYGEDSKFSFARNSRNETTASIQIPLKEAVCD